MSLGVAKGAVISQQILMQRVTTKPAIDACNGYAAMFRLALEVAERMVLNEAAADAVVAEGLRDTRGCLDAWDGNGW
jgi:hypothetical protein